MLEINVLRIAILQIHIYKYYIYVIKAKLLDIKICGVSLLIDFKFLMYLFSFLIYANEISSEFVIKIILLALRFLYFSVGTRMIERGRSRITVWSRLA